MDNYSGKNIKILKGLEPVRQRPGMYIGSTGIDGLHHLIWEVLDNSIDEYLAGYTNNIEININSETNEVSISDNGRGIPVDIIPGENISALRAILSSLHSGGKFNHDVYKTSGGLHGVGISVVNALSSKFLAQIERDGYLYEDKYERGIPQVSLKNGEIVPIKKSNNTGTKIFFIPDEEIFGNIKFDEDRIKDRLHEIVCLNDCLLIKLIFDNKETVFKDGGGIKKLLEEEIEDSETLTNIIELPNLDLKDDIFCNIVFQYVDENSENIKSFVNNVPTKQGGTHEIEFKSALTRVINNYAKTLNVSKDGFIGNDIRTGLVAIIDLKIKDPVFVGQTKDKLDVPKISSIIGQNIRTKIEYYFDRNRKDLEKVLNIINDIVKDKKKSDDLKALKKKKKSMVEISSKLAAPTSKNYKERELFLVEGDSAGGSAKQARDRKTQGILPLRGKVLNIQRVPITRALKNQEISTIIQILGAGFGKDFNSANLKYNNIVILSDADIDGKHIQTLLLTMFYNLMPDLIKNGHLYIAIPPLYRVVDNKGKAIYLYSDNELEKHKKKNNVARISRFKGLGEMNPSELKETTMDKNTRKLKIITMEDAVSAEKQFKNIMGNNSDYRKTLLVENY